MLGMNNWSVVDRARLRAADSDSVYKELLLRSLSIDVNDTNFATALAERSDSLYHDVGHLFRSATDAIMASPTKGRYLLLFGQSATDKDVFTLLFSFDVFPQFAECLSDIKKGGCVEPLHMTNLIMACAS